MPCRALLCLMVMLFAFTTTFFATATIDPQVLTRIQQQMHAVSTYRTIGNLCARHNQQQCMQYRENHVKHANAQQQQQQQQPPQAEELAQPPQQPVLEDNVLCDWGYPVDHPGNPHLLEVKKMQAEYQYDDEEEGNVDTTNSNKATPPTSHSATPKAEPQEQCLVNPMSNVARSYQRFRDHCHQQATPAACDAVNDIYQQEVFELRLAENQKYTTKTGEKRDVLEQTVKRQAPTATTTATSINTINPDHPHIPSLCTWAEKTHTCEIITDLKQMSTFWHQQTTSATTGPSALNTPPATHGATPEALVAMHKALKSGAAPLNANDNKKSNNNNNKEQSVPNLEQLRDKLKSLRQNAKLQADGKIGGAVGANEKVLRDMKMNQHNFAQMDLGHLKKRHEELKNALKDLKLPNAEGNIPQKKPRVHTEL